LERILEMLALNGVAAAAIALPALLAARLGKHAVAHTLWVLLFAKLLIPPTIGVRVPEALFARSEPPALSAARMVGTAEAPRTGDSAPVALPASTSRSASPAATALFLIEIAGALAVVGTAAFRAVRFRRLLEQGAGALPAAEVLPVARRLGLRAAPPVRLVAAPIPPALWPGPPCEILIPADLWEGLDRDQKDALLAHELAHARRGDHWVRPLELIATAITWWYPLTWWARGRLRASEEACCDALVLRAGAAHERAYAGALIETLSFLARRTAGPVPALATGAGEFARIQERFAMILRRETDSPPSHVTRAALLALGLIVLLVGPSGSKSAVNESTAPPTAAAPEAPEVPAAPVTLVTPPAAPATLAPPAAPAPPAEPAWAAELDRLRAREMELQRRIEEIEMQRARLEVEMQEWQAKSEALRVQREAAELERQGHAEEAKLLREQLALFEAQVSLHRARFEADEAHRKAEQELRDRMRQLEPPHTPTPGAPPHR
jgi:beta-lactamase regulating signal transducer with metallopeptidase domain